MPNIGEVIAGGVALVLTLLFRLQRDVGENTALTRTILDNHLPHVAEDIRLVRGDVKEVKEGFLTHLLNHAKGELKSRREDINGTNSDGDSRGDRGH